MSIEHMDMKDQIIPLVGIDIYKSAVADDDQIITLSFMVTDKAVATDLVEWFERGYDWIIDADISEGEVGKSKYLVFVEISRRTRAPDRILELIDDLETLCDIKRDTWSVRIAEKTEPATVEFIKDNLVLSPLEYREKQQTQLNEMRKIAGLPIVPIYDSADQELQLLQRQAGII